MHRRAELYTLITVADKTFLLCLSLSIFVSAKQRIDVKSVVYNTNGVMAHRKRQKWCLYFCSTSPKCRLMRKFCYHFYLLFNVINWFQNLCSLF